MTTDLVKREAVSLDYVVDMDVDEVIVALDDMYSKANKSDDPRVKIEAITQLRMLEVRTKRLKINEIQREINKRELMLFRNIGEGINKKIYPVREVGKIGFDKHDVGKARWIAALPDYAYNHVLAKVNPDVKMAFRLAKKYFEFKEIAIQYGLEDKERSELIKKYVLTSINAKDFTEILENVAQEDEGEIEVDDDDMDIEVLITESVRSTIRACHVLVKRLAKVEETMEVATYYVDDDLDLLANVSSILNTVNDRVMEIHEEITAAFEGNEESDFVKVKMDTSNKSEEEIYV